MKSKTISSLGFILFIGGIVSFISHLLLVVCGGAEMASVMSAGMLIIGSILVAAGVICLSGAYLLSPKEQEKTDNPPIARKNFFENISRERVIPSSKETPKKPSVAVNYTRSSFVNWEEQVLRNEPEFKKMLKTLQTYKPIVPTLKDTSKPKTETSEKPTEANNATPLTVTIKNVTTSWFLHTCGISYNPPTLHDFGISDKELALYEKYGNRAQRYQDRWDKIRGYCLWGNVIFSWLFLIYCMCTSTDIGALTEKFPGITGYIAVGVLYGYTVYGLLIDPLYWLSLGIGYIYIKVKPLFSSQQEKKTEKKIENYLKAKESFTKEHPLHKTLADYDYKIENYVSAYAIPKFIQKVKTFVERENRDIKDENLRADQNFWFRLAPYDFEKEVARWFRAQGYKAEVTSKTGDGGIDIKLTHPTEGILYVQCKRYCSQKVDRPTLQQLYGAICADANQGVIGGAIVCLVGLSNAALDFARKVGIRIYTIHDLAPEDTLFEQRIRKDLLDTSLRQFAPLEYRIGNIDISAICYLDKAHITMLSSEYYITEYCRVYFVIKCLPDVFERFK